MGAGLATLLTRNDLRVLTPLEGRSEATRLRAATAGMEEAGYADLLQAELIMSIVPPAQAAGVATRLADLGRHAAMPAFVECNAISPAAKRALERMIESAGGRLLDGVIIGSPPRSNGEGPRLYVSGECATAAALLCEAGLDVRVLPGPVGTAAALKMCYGGLNKGITALTTAALLAARRAHVEKALIEEFAISQRHLLERSQSSVPGMYPKAARWVAEFEEIAEFNADDRATADIFKAIARFYEERAEAHRKDAELSDLLAILRGTHG